MPISNEIREISEEDWNNTNWDGALLFCFERFTEHENEAIRVIAQYFVQQVMTYNGHRALFGMSCPDIDEDTVCMVQLVACSRGSDFTLTFRYIFAISLDRLNYTNYMMLHNLLDLREYKITIAQMFHHSERVISAYIGRYYGGQHINKLIIKNMLPTCHNCIECLYGRARFISSILFPNLRTFLMSDYPPLNWNPNTQEHTSFELIGGVRTISISVNNAHERDIIPRQQ